MQPEYQLVSIGLILSITIFAESLAKPRPSQFMCVMESLEELVVCTIIHTVTHTHTHTHTHTCIYMHCIVHNLFTLTDTLAGKHTQA